MEWRKLEVGNMSNTRDFIFLGLTNDWAAQIVLFLLFSVVYLITMVGNIGLIVLTITDSRLHSPMYFFLCNLSFVDACYSSVVVPKMLAQLITGNKVITYVGCVIQFYFFLVFVITEQYVLMIMAYDRFVAICFPLVYTTKMSKRTCILLATFTYVFGVSDAGVQTFFTFTLTYCGSHDINHFFCSDPPLLKLSCTNTSKKEFAVFWSSGFNLTTTGLLISISYICIIVAITKIRSTEAKKKTFNTCASHFTTVSIFYGTLLIYYLQPVSTHTIEQDKVLSIFYAVFVPMLNPLIYSLRNKEVKDAVKKVFLRACAQ
ncbi:olfactory receptor 5AR1-like [Ambystoma mexicanum]|uniref:olfactory receptor 5AR1-like n=1 Tax=Ambystoma mexicanum TaxID=8296 RepID=UPI0037E86722